LNKPDIKFREPSLVMKLSRLGSFHQSKLSFLRSFIREFKNWNYSRNLFDLIYLILMTKVTVLLFILLKKKEEIIL